MSIHISEIDVTVSTYLKTIDTTYNVIYVANRENDKEWQCDEWLIQLGNESFSYRTGLGHRITPNTKRPFTSRISLNDKKVLKKIRECTGLDFSAHQIIKNRGHMSGIYAVIPTQASVLYCLLLDSQALDESFDNWADNYGYSTDSITHLNIYQACCNNAKQLRKAFTSEQQTKLNELLEEY